MPQKLYSVIVKSKVHTKLVRHRNTADADPDNVCEVGGSIYDNCVAVHKFGIIASTYAICRIGNAQVRII